MPQPIFQKALKKQTLTYLSVFILLVSCSKENDNPGNIDNFFKGAQSSASIDDLVGVWAIFSAEFDGEKIAVPINYPECGRDFFVYSRNGGYTEYLYPNDSCEPEVNRLTWQLENGVITLSNNIGQSDELVVTKVNDQELVFKSRFDVDSDGELDVLILTANRYQAEEFDLTTSTFNQNPDEDFEDVLSLLGRPMMGSIPLTVTKSTEVRVNSVQRPMPNWSQPLPM